MSVYLPAFTLFKRVGAFLVKKNSNKPPSRIKIIPPQNRGDAKSYFSPKACRSGVRVLTIVFDGRGWGVMVTVMGEVVAGVTGTDVSVAGGV